MLSRRLCPLWPRSALGFRFRRGIPPTTKCPAGATRTTERSGSSWRPATRQMGSGDPGSRRCRAGCAALRCPGAPRTVPFAQARPRSGSQPGSPTASGIQFRQNPIGDRSQPGSSALALAPRRQNSSISTARSPWIRPVPQRGRTPVHPCFPPCTGLLGLARSFPRSKRLRNEHPDVANFASKRLVPQCSRRRPRTRRVVEDPKWEALWG